MSVFLCPIFYSDTKLSDRFIFQNKRFIFKNRSINFSFFMYRIDLKKQQNSLMKVVSFRTVFWSLASLFTVNNIYIWPALSFFLNSFKYFFADNGRMTADCIILPTLPTVCFSFHLRKRSIMIIDFNRGAILAKSEILCYY